MASGPTESAAGFDFPLFDFITAGSVPGSVKVLRSALILRGGLDGAGAASRSRDIDAILLQEFLRLAATGSRLHPEARQKASLLSEGRGIPGFAVTPQAEAMLDAAVAFEEAFFGGPLPQGWLRGGPARTDFGARVSALKGAPLPPGQDKVVAAQTGRIRIEASADQLRDRGNAERPVQLLVRPSKASRCSIPQLLAALGKLDRDLEAYVGLGDLHRARVATVAVNDLALTLAARAPATRSEAQRCIDYIVGHLAAFNGYVVNLAFMFGASVDATSQAWQISAPDAQPYVAPTWGTNRRRPRRSTTFATSNRSVGRSAARPRPAVAEAAGRPSPSSRA